MTNDSMLVTALRNVQAHAPPQTLFRFNRSSDLTGLTKGRLKLTPPAFFNDPFEMWAGIATDTLTEEKMIRSLTAPEGLFRLTIRAYSPEKLSDIRAYDQSMADAVRRNPTIWPEHPRSLVGSIKELSRRQIGAYCLSAFSQDEMLGEVGIHHWAMYGEDHHGFCIEYDGTHTIFTSTAEAKWFFPVSYRPERVLFDVNDFDTWNDAKMWRTLREWVAMKSEAAWGHEKEWRLIHPIGRNFSHWWYAQEGKGKRRRYFLRLWTSTQSAKEKSRGSAAIQKIWLGCNADDALQNIVVAAIQKPHLRHVEVWKLLPCERRFRLIPVRVA